MAIHLRKVSVLSAILPGPLVVAAQDRVVAGSPDKLETADRTTGAAQVDVDTEIRADATEIRADGDENSAGSVGSSEEDSQQNQNRNSEDRRKSPFSVGKAPLSLEDDEAFLEVERQFQATLHRRTGTTHSVQRRAAGGASVPAKKRAASPPPGRGPIVAASPRTQHQQVAGARAGGTRPGSPASTPRNSGTAPLQQGVSGPPSVAASKPLSQRQPDAAQLRDYGGGSSAKPKATAKPVMVVRQPAHPSDHATAGGADLHHLRVAANRARSLPAQRQHQQPVAQSSPRSPPTSARGASQKTVPSSGRPAMEFSKNRPAPSSPVAMELRSPASSPRGRSSAAKQTVNSPAKSSGVVATPRTASSTRAHAHDEHAVPAARTTSSGTPRRSERGGETHSASRSTSQKQPQPAASYRGRSRQERYQGVSSGDAQIRMNGEDFDFRIDKHVSQNKNSRQSCPDLTLNEVLEEIESSKDQKRPEAGFARPGRVSSLLDDRNMHPDCIIYQQLANPDVKHKVLRNVKSKSLTRRGGRGTASPAVRIAFSPLGYALHLGKKGKFLELMKLRAMQQQTVEQKLVVPRDAILALAAEYEIREEEIDAISRVWSLSKEPTGAQDKIDSIMSFLSIGKHKSESVMRLILGRMHQYEKWMYLGLKQYFQAQEEVDDASFDLGNLFD
ncbi:unnamed protein product [Amoebophrya sp. A120]|nr:unnamed protein product [Amoebophrya sp. A120]|eukprot:GSA120T00004321001.1